MILKFQSETKHVVLSDERGLGVIEQEYSKIFKSCLTVAYKAVHFEAWARRRVTAVNRSKWIKREPNIILCKPLLKTVDKLGHFAWLSNSDIYQNVDENLIIFEQNFLANMHLLCSLACFKLNIAISDFLHLNTLWKRGKIQSDKKRQGELRKSVLPCNFCSFIIDIFWA